MKHSSKFDIGFFYNGLPFYFVHLDCYNANILIWFLEFNKINEYDVIFSRSGRSLNSKEIDTLKSFYF